MAFFAQTEQNRTAQPTLPLPTKYLPTYLSALADLALTYSPCPSIVSSPACWPAYPVPAAHPLPAPSGPCPCACPPQFPWCGVSYFVRQMIVHIRRAYLTEPTLVLVGQSSLYPILSYPILSIHR